VIDIRPGLGKQLPGAFVHYAHAVVFQKLQRGQVDLFQLVSTEDLLRGVAIDRLPPG
jgi:hypothetical protein